MSYISDIIETSKLGPVFPLLHNNGPTKEGWQRWATTDKEKIKKYWKLHPKAGVGLCTGKKSGITVVDLDVKNGKDGVEAYKKLLGVDRFERCTYQKTKSGGLHLFYTFIEGDTNKTDIVSEGSGIDVRGEGGYIAIYPTADYSLHLHKLSAQPEPLRKYLLKKPRKKKSLDSTEYSFEYVESTLMALDAKEYRSRSSWMEVMMATHNATSGSEKGKELFTAWSKTDGHTFKYDSVEYVDKMWDTLDADRADGITFTTLKSKAISSIPSSDFSIDEELEIEVQDVTSQPHDIVTEHDEVAEDVWLREVRKVKGGVSYELGRGLPNAINFICQSHLPPELGGGENNLHQLFKRNELTDQVTMTKRPPWATKSARDEDYVNIDISNNSLTEFRSYIHLRHSIPFSKTVCEDAVEAAASRCSFHPIRDYLDSLVWDKTPRLTSWLTSTAGIEDNRYTREVQKCVILAAVARVYHPGCRVDNAMVLEGGQGIGKSGLVDILGGEWYAAPKIDIGSLDAEQNIQGKWIVEWAEMSSSRPKDADAIKAYLTSKVARFRASYGRSSKDWPRKNIFIITLNPRRGSGWLSDPTGGRRFWPITLRQAAQKEKINFRWLEKNRAQIFAEAAQVIKTANPHDIRTAKLWTLSPKAEATAAVEQEKRLYLDNLTPVIVEATAEGGDLCSAESITPVQATEVMFGVRSITDAALVRRVSTAFARIGWDATKVKGTLVYMRPFDEA